MDINQPQFYPRNNMLGALCYSARGTEIETVMVDGKILIENGKSTTLDEEKIYYEASKDIERISQ